MDNNYYPLNNPETVLQPPVEMQIVPNVTVNVAGGTIDPRSVVSQFLAEHGQMVIVQRMNMKIHCMFCWHDKLGEPDPLCPYCLGRGYLSIFERHLTRRTSSLNAHRLQLLDELPMSPQIIDELYWYFEWFVNPRVEDSIYEVTWADPQQLTIHSLIASYRVNYTYPFRDIGGRIEYWSTTCRSRPIDAALKENHLRAVSNISLKIPDDGIIRYVTASQT